MHAVHSFSIEGCRLLPLLLFLHQCRTAYPLGGAHLKLSAKQHARTGAANKDHRKHVGQHTILSRTVATLKNNSSRLNLTSATSNKKARPLAYARGIGANGSNVSFPARESTRVTAVANNNALASSTLAAPLLMAKPSGVRAPRVQSVVRRSATANSTRFSSGHMSHSRDSKPQSLMRSENSKRGKKRASKPNLFVWPMQIFNDGHMSVLPAEKARANTPSERGFESNPSDSIGKQAFIVDQSGDAAPESELAPRRDDHGSGKPQNGLARRRGSASEDLDAKGANAVTPILAQSNVTARSEARLSMISVVIIALLLLTILLLLDISLHNRLRERQDLVATDNMERTFTERSSMSAAISTVGSSAGLGLGDTFTQAALRGTRIKLSKGSSRGQVSTDALKEPGNVSTATTSQTARSSYERLHDATKDASQKKGGSRLQDPSRGRPKNTARATKSAMRSPSQADSASENSASQVEAKFGESPMRAVRSSPTHKAVSFHCESSTDTRAQGEVQHAEDEVVV